MAACLCLARLSVPPAYALDPETAGTGKNTPIIITARSLIADNKKKEVTYKKDVVVKKGDLTLYADTVVIHLKPSEKGAGQDKDGVLKGSGRIETIEAVGGVKIVQEDKTATAGKAVYYSEGDKIVLTGKPRVWQGGNVLDGSKITYNLKDDTVSVEDANTVLYQEGGGPR